MGEKKNRAGTRDLGPGSGEGQENNDDIEIVKMEEAILEWIGPEDVERMKKYLLPSEKFRKSLLRRIIAKIRGKHSR